MELGSEYNLDLNRLEYTQDNVYTYLVEKKSIFMDSGRGALQLLLKSLPKGKVLMPNYICDSVIDCFEKDYEIKSYQINTDFTIDIKDIEEKLSSEIKILYIVQYFGSLMDSGRRDKILEWKRKYNFIIIEDTTHSIFSKSCMIGDYCICSLRKWFPIPDGGVLYGEPHHMDKLIQKKVKDRKNIEKVNAMFLKTLYLQGKLECNELYRKIFVEEENRLDMQTELWGMSSFSRWLLSFFSISQIQEIRKKNVRYLYSRLQQLYYAFSFKEEETPFTLPIYRKDRDNFRRYLIEHNIFCAVHWPILNKTSIFDKHSEEISAHILSLPIDQRYGTEEMDYMIKVIKNYTEI